MYRHTVIPSFTVKTTVTPVLPSYRHPLYIGMTVNDGDGDGGKNLGGSHENALELVKTLIVIFPIVNFPAEGSQTPMIPHFSNAPKFL